jgi:hypothetical protein
MDYLNEEDRSAFMEDIIMARGNMNKRFVLLGGYGPKVGDIKKEEALYVIDP